MTSVCFPAYQASTEKWASLKGNSLLRGPPHFVWSCFQINSAQIAEEGSNQNVQMGRLI